MACRERPPWRSGFDGARRAFSGFWPRAALPRPAPSSENSLMNRHRGSLLSLLLFSLLTAQARADVTAKKHALLIGCTKYQRETITELWGPANDVPRVRDLLINRFGFPRDGV